MDRPPGFGPGNLGSNPGRPILFSRPENYINNRKIPVQMSEENGQAVREAVAKYIRASTGEQDITPNDSDLLTTHVEDFYDASELAMLLVERFPDSEEQIDAAMRNMGLNATTYDPSLAPLKTYEDLYAALDGVK